MFPTPNQWLDIRKTELTNTYYAKDYDPGETNVREHEAQSRRVDYSIALEIDDYIHEFSRNGLRRQDHDGLYVPKVLFASKASKYGTYLPMADVNSMLIDKHLSFFGELWKQMSGGLNAKLSQGMQPMWFKCYDDIPDDQIYTVASHSESERLIAKKGLLTMNLIRDPVFKIIDDWMSSLYRYHPENELNDLQEYRLPFLELMANEVIVTGQLSNFYRI